MKQEGGSMLEVKRHVKWIMKHIVKCSSKHVREKNEKCPNPMCCIRGMLRIITINSLNMMVLFDSQKMILTIDKIY
jgi:hypothetical protein